MYVDKHYQMHFQIVYPNTFRIVVKQLLRTEENGYRDVSYYSLNQFIKPIELLYNETTYYRKNATQVLKLMSCCILKFGFCKKASTEEGHKI